MRTNRKLRLLDETEGLNELLYDLIDLIEDKTEEEKIDLVKTLRATYLLHGKKQPRQGSLFTQEDRGDV